MFSHVCLFKDFPVPQDWQTDKNSWPPARPPEKNQSSKVLSLIQAKFIGWSRREGEWVATLLKIQEFLKNKVAFLIPAQNVKVLLFCLVRDSLTCCKTKEWAGYKKFEMIVFPLFLHSQQTFYLQEVSSASRYEKSHEECLGEEEEPAGGSEWPDWRQLHAIRQASHPEDHQEAEEEVRVQDASYCQVSETLYLSNLDSGFNSLWVF